MHAYMHACSHARACVYQALPMHKFARSPSPTNIYIVHIGTDDAWAVSERTVRKLARGVSERTRCEREVRDRAVREHAVHDRMQQYMSVQLKMHACDILYLLCFNSSKYVNGLMERVFISEYNWVLISYS